ncbi:MAG: HNH endonuclease, partial [Proteobacteria bacterium]
MTIKTPALKELYGKAAGRCAICPGYESVFLDSVCDISLTDQNIAEMAHVIAKRGKGPRGEEVYKGDINSYDNLILLCRNHHRAVDANPEKFTTSWLKNKKLELELWVNQRLESNPNRRKDVSALCAFMKHVPFTKIRGQYEDLPDCFDVTFFDAGEILKAFPIDLPDARPFFDNQLE